MPHARSATQKKRRNARRRTKTSSHPWQVELEELRGAVPTKERRDGAGAPWVTQWDHVSVAEENWQGVLSIVEVLTEAVQDFMNENDDFLSRFMAADREGQTEMANEWPPLVEVANMVRPKIEHRLKTMGCEDDDLQGWGLMKELARLTTEFEEATTIHSDVVWDKDDYCEEGLEDLVICDLMKEGVPIGFYEPIPENKAWPPYVRSGAAREGEPTDGELRWAAEKLNDMSWAELPIGKIDSEMEDKLAALIREELEQGRIRRIGKHEIVACSKQLAIWKPNKNDIRPLDDYRRSGLNRVIRNNLRTTICLPRLQDICAMLAEMPISDSFRVFEADLEHAFRVVEVCERDRPLLSFIRPGQREDQELEIYQHNVLPFGLITSPVIFCRGAAVGFRVSKRLLAVALASMDGRLPNKSDSRATSDQRRQMRSVPLGFRAMLYVDDVSASVPRHAKFAACFTLLVLIMVGFPISFKKVKILAEGAIILGFETSLNEEGDGITLRVPAVKIKQICDEIAMFCASKSVKVLNRLEGRLSWAAQIARPLARKMNVVRELTAVAAKHNLRTLSISEQRVEQLLSLGDLLRDYGHCSIPYVASSNTTVPGTGIPTWCVCTDACLEGMAGVMFPLCAKDNTWWFNINATDDDELWSMLLKWRGVTPPPGQARGKFLAGDINFLELAAVGVALKLLEYSQQRVGYVHCLTDNSATMGVLRKLKARSASLNQIVMSVGFSRFQIECTHIQGERNLIADTLSRSSRSSCRQQVPAEWFEADKLSLNFAANHLIEVF